MKIIITDLTRFARDNIVCAAGINPNTKEVIRPMPYIRKSECERLSILPGAVISGEFINSSNAMPHSEDRHYINKLKFHGASSSDDFKAILEDTRSRSLEEGFKVNMAYGQKHIDPSEKPGHSLITLAIKPSKICIVRDRFNAEKVKVTFTESSGKVYRYISITDLGFHSYAKKSADNDKIDELNMFISSQAEVYMRIGLSRLYTASDGRTGYWLQGNGIYTFPDFFKDIRCYI